MSQFQKFEHDSKRIVSQFSKVKHDWLRIVLQFQILKHDSKKKTKAVLCPMVHDAYIKSTGCLNRVGL